MADVKISSLPASTTPLAGTEVLPVVQSGVTKKVASDDLTVKNLRSNATTGILQVTGPAAAATRVMTAPDANFSVARIDAAQSFTGDQTLSTGNLVIGTSGKGIDFSATAGTGTSELLADYEEGNWTPVIGASSGAITSYTTTNCKYTKIGRQVTLNGTFGITNNGTGIGAVTISSVPFAILNSIAGGVAREAAVNGLMSMIVAGNTGTLNMTLYNNVYPGVTGGSYTFTITYFV